MVGAKKHVPQRLDQLIGLLRETRQRQGRSYEEIGMSAGLDPSALWRIETVESHDPWVATMDAYASALRFVTYYLLGDVGKLDAPHRGFSHIPSILLQARQNLGLTRREAASLRGRGERSLFLLEHGDIFPRLSTLYSWAKVYNLVPLVLVEKPSQYAPQPDPHEHP